MTLLSLRKKKLKERGYDLIQRFINTQTVSDIKLKIE